MQRLQMNPPWKCGLISLINSYLAFSFFPFLGQRYCNYVYIRSSTLWFSLVFDSWINGREVLDVLDIY